MASDTIAMICEDAACELDQEINGIRPLQHLIPKLIEFYANPDPILRVQAINATSQFVLLKPASFVMQLDHILAALYKRASDTDPRVRQELGRILAVILEAFPEKLEPYLYPTIEYMIKATTDQDQEILLGACDFWVQYAQSEYYHQELIAYLPRLVECLLKLMVYSDTDLLDIGHGDADNRIGNAVTTTCINKLKMLEDQSIRPRFYRPKNQSDHPNTTAAAAAAAAEAANRHDLSDLEEDTDSSSSGGEHEENEEINSNSSNSSNSDNDNDSDISDDEDQDSDEDFDDDEFYSEDSLRKCSAAALDALSVSFGDEIAPIILNLLFNETLVSENWLVRESGILALGAAAEGIIYILHKQLSLLTYIFFCCFSGGIQVISHHLHRLVPFLLTCMEDQKV
jgi:transportin-1